MISADFSQSSGRLRGVTVSGHAMFAPEGEDIVCAGVTSALQLVCNAVTEILCADADVTVRENQIALSLSAQSDGSCAEDFLRALYLHYSLMSKDYPQHIKVTLSEV